MGVFYLLQQVSFKSLVERNKKAQERGHTPHTNSTIELPFIIVNTDKKTNIDCSISNDKYVLCINIYIIYKYFNFCDIF